MLKKINLTIGFICLFLTSCKVDPTKSLETFVGNIFAPIIVTVTPRENFGEVITTDEPIEVIVEVKNNSSDPFTNLLYTFDRKDNIYEFKASPEGSLDSPGFGGTCKTQLDPGKSCRYVLELIPRKQGIFSIPGTITYLNRVAPQSKELVIDISSGEAASIVFTNGKSFYNLGTFEQTERIDRFIDIEVENAGGLTAKNLDVSLLNNDFDPAYELISHDCPKHLAKKMKCTVNLKYFPTNNEYSDPEMIPTASLKFSYIKDPAQNQVSVSNSFSFTATTIEAKFKTNYPTLEFDKLVAGNKSTKVIKVTNQGYRAGILRAISLYKENGTLAATCIKGSDQYLDCGKSLYEFPFKIEDNNSCLGREVADVNQANASSSPNCFFNVTYWPSVDYLAGSQSTHNFNNAKLSFTYDSRWLGNENIVTKNNMFKITADFLARANLILSGVEINNVGLDQSSITQNNDAASAQLGRLAMISPSYPDVFYPVKLKYKNTGEVPADFVSLSDGKASPNTIITFNESNPESPRNLNLFYKQIQQSNCLTLPPGAECSIYFQLSPIKQASQIQTDESMYDNTSNPFEKFKTFNFAYKDGSLFLDNGSAHNLRTIKTDMISQLMLKGILRISPVPINFGYGLTIGSDLKRDLKLTNIGTGKISAIQYSPSLTLEVPSAGTDNAPSGAAAGKNPYPFRISTYAANFESLPIGSVKDCSNLIYPSSDSFPFPLDSSKILDEAETCSLRIQAKLPKNSDTLYKNISTPTDEFKRFWAEGLNNTQDIWMTSGAGSKDASFEFNYWDGDYNPDDSLSSSHFGYMVTTKSNAEIKSSWQAAAMLYIARMEPVASTSLFRPEITYPEILETFPSKTKLNASVTPIQAKFFTNRDMLLTTVPPFALRNSDITTFHQSLGSTYQGSIPTISVGTIKKLTDFYTNITFANNGLEKPSTLKLEDQGGSSGFSVTKFNNQTGAGVWSTFSPGSSDFDISFKINIASSGIHERCYKVIYGTNQGERKYHFCLVAKIKDNAPLLSLEYKNYDINFDSALNNFVEVADTNWTTFSAPLNKYPTCDQYSFFGCTTALTTDKSLSFTTVFSSATCKESKNCQYDKKTLRIKNTGNESASSLKIEMSKDPSNYYQADTSVLKILTASQCSDIKNNFSALENKIAVCENQLNACSNIAAGGFCDLDIYFTPTAQMAKATDKMFVLSYRADSDVGSISRYNQYIPVSFEGLKSSIAKASTYMRKGIDSGVNDSGIPVTASSYPAITNESIGNWANPNIPLASGENSYLIPLDSYSSGYNSTTTSLNSKYLLNSNPKTLITYLTITNDSASRISFLKANPNPSGSMWNQVYPEWDNVAGAFKTYPSNHGSSKTIINASQGCFWGELKNSPIADSQKGFNNLTGSDASGDNGPQAKCQLQVIFSGDITYSAGCDYLTKVKTTNLGGEIDSKCIPYAYKIPYWSYKRSAGDEFKVHLRGFIEPPQAESSGGTITEIKAEYINSTSARIKFKLPSSITEKMPSFGTISKFRIFWTKDSEKFKYESLFSKSPPKSDFCWIDTPNNASSQLITISTCSSASLSVAPGTYYYIKILAINNINPSHPNKNDIVTFSSDPKIPILIVATPKADMTYLDQIKGFVDHKLIATNKVFTMSGAIDYCQKTSSPDNRLSIMSKSTTTYSKRALINYNIFKSIVSGEVPSLTTGGYPNGPGYIPHWLSDTAINISTGSIPLYNGTSLNGGFPNFVNTDLININHGYNISYTKTCSDKLSCNNLNMVIGGDDAETLSNGIMFTSPTTQIGFARCFVPIRCPIEITNSSTKLLSDTSCKLNF